MFDLKNLGEAVNTPLGIVALCINALCALALYFFRREEIKVKMSIFLVLMAGIGILIFALLRNQNIQNQVITKRSVEPCTSLAGLTNGSNQLNISFVEHSNDVDSLEKLMIRMVHDIKDKFPGFPFDGVLLTKSDYGDSPQKYSQATIATVKAAEYVRIKEHADLIPLLVVLKEGQKDPTLPASFIVNNSSPIVNLNSLAIKRIYLVNSHSLTGYIAPLAELYDRQIIPHPSIEGCHQKGWEVQTVEDHNIVISRIRDDRDAIGATGQYVASDPLVAGVKQILSYGEFPQDVLVVSRDLEVYQNEIKNWLIRVMEGNSCEKHLLARSATRITGFSEMTPLLRNLYDDVEALRKKVR